MEGNTEKALIISTENKIEAVHFEMEECATCTTGCAKIKNSFEVLNPFELEIKKALLLWSVQTKSLRCFRESFLCLFHFYVPLQAIFQGLQSVRFSGKP